MVNLHGHTGVGKTTFAKWLGYYLNVRYKFFNGIYYLSIRNVKNSEEFKDMIKQ